MSKESIFGRFTEKEGEETTTLCCRVTKETRKLFEAHAKSKYGSVTTGLKRILFDYLSQYPFRRQTFVYTQVNVFVPFDFKDNDYEVPLINIEDTIAYEYLGGYNPNHLEESNPNDTMSYAMDYRGFNPSNHIEKENYDNLAHWIYKNSNFNIDDGVVIEGTLNNYLDKKIDGIYKANEFEDNSHGGLLIFKFEEEYHYIIFSFEVEETYRWFTFTSQAHLVSNEEAYKMAIECDNIELAKFIDSLNEGTSNIDGNIKLLEDKKKSLQHQIEEIDDKLSKLK